MPNDDEEEMRIGSTSRMRERTRRLFARKSSLSELRSLRSVLTMMMTSSAEVFSAISLMKR